MARSKYPGIKLLNEIGTKKDIAAAYGVSERTIYRWQNKAKAESGERQQYPGAKTISKFKGTRKELAKKYNVSERTAYRWVNKAKAQGAPIESRQQKSKYPGTAILEEEGSNRTIADRYNVSKSTIQRWKQKAQKELSFEMPEEIITPEPEENNLDIDKNIKADFEQDETQEDFEGFEEPGFDESKEGSEAEFEEATIYTPEDLTNAIKDSGKLLKDSIFYDLDPDKQVKYIDSYIKYQAQHDQDLYYLIEVMGMPMSAAFDKASTLNIWGDYFETWLSEQIELDKYGDDWLDDL